MIVYEPPAHVTNVRPTLVATDALTRIPTAHFVNMTWAQDAVATCLKIIASANGGDDRPTAKWISDATHSPKADSLLSVLSAACDAMIADAFRAQGDIRNVSHFLTAFERNVFAELAAQRQQKDVDAMNDPDTLELAAGLVRVVQMHDADTATHLDATGALGRRIAATLGLTPNQAAVIELAGRLHDIGKVGIRKYVLCKTGPLNSEELAEMRLHSEAGASVLVDTPKLAHLAPIVRAHHERMDGHGYPDRLRGHEIPIEARVIAVADAFHAMTTERPYRHAMMPNEALAELAENAGAQFDSDVVEATFELFRYVRRARRAIA